MPSLSELQQNLENARRSEADLARQYYEKLYKFKSENNITRLGSNKNFPKDITDLRDRLPSARESVKSAAKGFVESGQEGEHFSLLDHDMPILLFPFRIETRFHKNPQNVIDELLIRVFPDDAVVATHEEKLTEAEIKDGENWQQICTSNDEKAKLQVWAGLFEKYGPERAAWIRKRFTPPAGQPLVSDKRVEGWTRAAACDVMPDFWMALTPAGDGGFTIRSFSSYIPSPLPVGPSFLEDPAAPNAAAPKKYLDDELKWLTDFEEAKKVGMGLRIQFSDDEKKADKGIDRLIVIGIRASSKKEESQKLLERLLDNHHYAEGMSFLKQGTPTNNTAEARSGYSSAGPTLEQSYEIESRQGLETFSDGHSVAAAFGIDQAIFQNIENADGIEEQEAQAMATVLWPATMGYYLKQLMADVFSDDEIEKAHGHFINYVRGRGPYPALRFGSMPYGILPITSLKKWEAKLENDGFELELPKLLQRLLSKWREMAENVPQICKSTKPEEQKPEEDLLRILGMQPTASTYFVRFIFTLDWLINYYRFVSGREAKPDFAKEYNEEIKKVLTEIEYPNVDPLITRTWPEDDQKELTNVPLIQSHPDHPPKKYIQWLLEQLPTDENDKELDELINDTYDEAKKPDDDEAKKPDEAMKPRPLLYLLLRHSLLLQYVDITKQILIKKRVLDKLWLKERIWVSWSKEAKDAKNALAEIIKTEIPAKEVEKEVGEKYSKYRERFPIPGRGVSAPPDQENQTAIRVGDYIRCLPPDTDAYKYLVIFDKVKAALNQLIKLPSENLEKLMAETLDVCSHRLDAWITALATERLKAARRKRSTGIYLGGYGWLENIRPNSQEAMNGGFIHAPSINHAVTAAVLRNAYLTHQDNQNAFAVDLSSKRVQRSLWILDGIRQGQSLGALLGYLFERNLHEHGLDQYIDDFRRLYPLKVSQEELKGEYMPARNVVDGFTLLEKYKETGIPTEILFKQDDLDAIKAQFKSLDDIYDGLADLGLAESVYQSTQGNFLRAGAILDAISSGSRPPEPEIAMTPHTGIRLTQRVVAVFDNKLKAPEGWVETPRAKASPQLNAWVGRELGSANMIKCKVKISKKNQSERNQEVSVDALQLSPLDFLYFAELNGDEEKNEGDREKNELEKRLEYYARTENGKIDLEAKVEVVFQRDSSWPAAIKTFPEMLQFARSLNTVVQNARPLDVRDMVLPEKLNQRNDLGLSEEQFQTGLTELEIKSMSERVGDICNEFFNGKDELDKKFGGDYDENESIPSYYQVLSRAGLYGISVSIPSISADVLQLKKKLWEQGSSTLNELQQRKDKIEAILKQIDGSQNTKSKNELLREIIDIIFGKSVKFLPEFMMNERIAAETSSSLAALASVAIAPDFPLRQWLREAALVRPQVQHYRTARIYAAAYQGQADQDLRVMQSPFKSGDRWIGQEFPVDQKPEQRPEQGKVSFVGELPVKFESHVPVTGLMIDEWLETIPNAKETTAVAFHYNQPSQEAPQALLLAVSPKADGSWDYDSLTSAVNETLDLAKVRTVDYDAINKFRHFLPALYFATNMSNETVSTDFPQGT